MVSDRRLLQKREIRDTSQSDRTGLAEDRNAAKKFFANHLMSNCLEPELLLRGHCESFPQIGKKPIT